MTDTGKVMTMEASFETPFGMGSVVVVDGLLAEVRLPRADGAPDPSAEPGPGGPRDVSDLPDPAATSAAEIADPAVAGAGTAADAAVAARWIRDLGDYFRGARRGWTEAEVHLSAYPFTPFRTAVYRALLDVPAGETVTYAELARRAGRPRAARAVGSAMAENPIAVVVPCHRVVRGDGSLGEYGFGTPWKRFLLESEGALPTADGQPSPGGRDRSGSPPR